MITSQHILITSFFTRFGAKSVNHFQSMAIIKITIISFELNCISSPINLLFNIVHVKSEYASKDGCRIYIGSEMNFHFIRYL